MINKIIKIFSFSFLIYLFYILPAHSIVFQDGDLTATVDTTLSYGATFRLNKRNPDLIGIANGGNAASVNGDNGNLNYSQGVVASAVKATHEINVDHRDTFGTFVRFTYFYDFHNADKSNLTNSAKNRVGRDIVLQDAYQYLHGRAFWDKAFSLKLGNQVLNWGESSFIRNGINGFNPVSASKIRIPGSEVRDALLPFASVDLNLGLTENLSIEGFYQFKWEESEPEAAGTFFSTNDFASPGGSSLFTGFGTTISPAAAIRRGADRQPRDHDQFGFALRYYADWLNQTEFGLYYTNYHSRLPLVGANVSPSPLTILSNSQYFLEYPEHIESFGASFNTELGKWGLSWQAEMSYKKDHPLQIHSVELLQAAVAPAVFLQLQAPPPTGLLLTPGQSQAVIGTNQVIQNLGLSNSPGFLPILGSELSGFRRFNVLTGQTTIAKVFPNTFKADQFILATELGFNYVTNMPKKSRLRLDAPATTRGGNPLLALSEGVQPSKTFPTDFSWGYVIAGKLEYLDFWKGINFFPKASFKHDVSGITPNPLGTFREFQKSISLGFEANWQNKWEFEVQYTNYFGAGRYNLLNDRSHIAAEIKYSF